MTAELKNLYENLIEEMILQGINGITDEDIELIRNAPVDKQRAMILTIMEENNPEHRLLCSKIRKAIEGQNTTATHRIKEVVQMLREYVKVSPTEVKTMGEVMTPISLVEEMLDTLPYEVWTNPDLKWFDPCNGVGIFLAVVIERLMKGLQTFEPNEELRYKHILENMIYANELQAKNCFLYMYAIDPEDKYAINIYKEDYLSEKFNDHMTNFWGLEKFDVIVMNPPYQERKEGQKKSKSIWDKFVVKTIDQLIEGGYLVAVHPDSWRGLGKSFEKVRNILKNRQILSLEIHDKNEGFKTFGATTTYDFYCLHNVPNTMFTKIKCEDGTIERVDISNMEFIPNAMYKTFEKLVAKKGEEKVNILYSRSAYGNDKSHMNKEQTETFKYPCIYYTYKDGSFRLYYSNTNKNGHFQIPKIIWSEGGASKPIIDENGEYGVMNFACAIIDEPKNFPFIQKAMLHPDFLKLMSYTDGTAGVGGQRYNRKAISLFRKDFWKEFLY